MFQFKECGWKRGESAVGLIGGTTKNISKREEFEGVSRLPLVGDRPHRRHDQKTFPRGRSLKVYRASRWSAIGLIGDTTKKHFQEGGV
jgi:hypothetical protein